MRKLLEIDEPVTREGVGGPPLTAELIASPKDLECPSIVLLKEKQEFKMKIFFSINQDELAHIYLAMRMRSR